MWDDNTHISENETLRSLHGLWQIWFQPGATCQYYPLTFSVFWVEYQLWGLNTLGYHLANIFFHGVVAILLWQVLERLKVRGAWLAGAIFALHPVCVMSVAWMTELKNTLSASLALLAGWAYLRAARLGVYGDREFQVSSFKFRESAKDKQEPLDLRFYALSLVLFACAMFAKTAVSFLPVTLLLVAWWQGRRLSWRTVWPLLPMVAVVAGMGLLTIHVEQSDMGGATGQRFDESFIQRILISGRSFWFYLEKLFFPTPAPFIYARWEIDSHTWWQWLFPLATVAMLGGAWLFRAKIGRALFAGLMHFYISTAFLILIFVLYFTNFSFVSDHWQYFGCMSVMALAAAGILRCLQFLKLGQLELPLCGGLLLVLAGLTWHQSGMYTDLPTLWRVTLERNPDCSMAHNYSAGLRFQKGDLTGAIAELREAIRLQPDSYEAHNNLGNALLQTGDVPTALSEFERAVAAKPRSATLHFNFGNALFIAGRSDDALSQYQAGIQLQPDLIWPKAPNLGQSSMGVAAWNLATSPDPATRNGERALQLAQQLDRLTEGRDALVLAELAAAYAELNQFADAAKTANSALQLPAVRSKSQLTSRLMGQLSEYQNGRPWRDTARQGPAGLDRR